MNYDPFEFDTEAGHDRSVWPVVLIGAVVLGAVIVVLVVRGIG